MERVFGFRTDAKAAQKSEPLNCTVLNLVHVGISTFALSAIRANKLISEINAKKPPFGFSMNSNRLFPFLPRMCIFLEVLSGLGVHRQKEF